VARHKAIGRQAPSDGAEAPSAPSRNTLLASLPGDELSSVLERCRETSFNLRQELFNEGDKIELGWFPLTGMGSLVTVLKDGTTLEALNVGREGFVGMELVNAVYTHQIKGICQIAGYFLEIRAPDFLELLKTLPHFQIMMRRYSQFAHEVVKQSAACNSIHLLEQRCARWLLMTSDAVGRPSFSLTQEFLSQMLAVRRAGVTVAVGALERKGLIEHHYGEVAIKDMKGLRETACECYSTIREKADLLLGDK